MKKLVTLRLSRTAVPAKIANARQYVSEMTGNANFPSPFPPLSSVALATDGLETAYINALDGGKALTAIMHEKEEELNDLLTLLGHYVEAAANGVSSVIISAGMKVRGTGGRIARTFHIANGNNTGELKLYSKYYKYTAYIWEMAEDTLPGETTEGSTHTWTQLAVTNRATFVVKGLTPGRNYWFRIASVNKNGQSAWSDPLSKRVSE